MRTCGVFLLFLICISCGCSSSLRTLPDGRQVPTRWTKAVEPLGQTRPVTPLRYDLVYVVDMTLLPGSRRAEWYRFWTNGRALLKFPLEHDSPATAVPNAANAEDFIRGIPSYYSVYGNRITIESASRDGYVIDTGVVNDDGSFTLTSRKQPGEVLLSTDTYSRNRTFRPQPVDAEMKRQPDW